MPQVEALFRTDGARQDVMGEVCRCQRSWVERLFVFPAVCCEWRQRLKNDGDLRCKSFIGESRPLACRSTQEPRVEARLCKGPAITL